MTEAIEVVDESAVPGSVPERSPRALAARFRPLRTRSGGNRDQLLLIIGGLAVPLGLLLIILGWVGSSRTPFVFEQIPYVISGGLLGTALVFSGGFVYFAYWQTRALRDARDYQQELVKELRNIAQLVAGANTNGNAAGNGHAAANSLDIGSGDALFVTTEKGSMFHRPECAVAQGRDNLRLVRGDEPGLRPCGICNPVLTTR